MSFAFFIKTGHSLFTLHTSEALLLKYFALKEIAQKTWNLPKLLINIIYSLSAVAVSIRAV